MLRFASPRESFSCEKVANGRDDRHLTTMALSTIWGTTIGKRSRVEVAGLNESPQTVA